MAQYPGKIITTNDGSLTIHSEKFDESYHSHNGAIQEAFFKFAVPSGIEKIAVSGALKILDIGFGLGYNALAAIHTAKSANPDCIVKIVSLEKYPVDVSVLDSLEIPGELREHYDIVKRAAKYLSFNKDDININIITGDARASIRTLDEKFDAVFLDPFSVKKNVELWTVDFFKELRERMTDSAILATYSASTPVRTGLMEAGFSIGPAPGDGMKRGGTLATIRACIPEFSEKEKRKFATSPERLPFHDPELNCTNAEILQKRNTSPDMLWQRNVASDRIRN